MSRAKAVNNQALILRRHATGDHDILVTALTLEQGKIRGLAKNAGRPGSARAPHLEPVNISTLQLIPAGELDFITQAVTIDPLNRVKDNLDTLAQAHCITETAEALTVDRNPAEDLYHLTCQCLKALPDSNPGDLVIRFFEYHALRINGTQPELHRCVECLNQVQPKLHRYAASLGGVICHRCNPNTAAPKPLSLRAMKVLRLIQTGDLERVRTFNVNRPLATELRHILAGSVSYNADRDIRSHGFLDSIRRKGAYTGSTRYAAHLQNIPSNGHASSTP